MEGDSLSLRCLHLDSPATLPFSFRRDSVRLATRNVLYVSRRCSGSPIFFRLVQVSVGHVWAAVWLTALTSLPPDPLKRPLAASPVFAQRLEDSILQ